MFLKLKIVIIVLGAIVGYNGYKEWNVSRGTSINPDVVALSELEKSPDISNNHLRVGAHTAVYAACVYEYRMEDGDTGEPTSETTVTHTYYPIISGDHPHILAINGLVEKYGDVDRVPDEEWPEFEQFTVLVKTGRFETIGDIPDEWTDCETLQGLVINRIYSLSEEEKDLIQESFPAMDFDSVLILEEGRTPTSSSKVGAMMGGGVVLILIGIGLFFVPKKKPTPSE